ncbi:MAG: 3'(2'),5'-bisphosphate nucleotidase CysQ [Puniceicoccales bacterium]|jgi:3'(2'), 5'-bisphosphate nucleotidase|nr:3'(2'),5'-bisphosphate nucleotidase CysQ [Puniceicoccales bacterium]
MLSEILKVAHLAGEKILEVYSQKNCDIKIKRDFSPVTQADLISHECITKCLMELSKYPIVSEESCQDYEIRKNFDTFWLIDPLDGTKDFIAGNNQFTINIALIENKEPILGIIYAPALKLGYYAEKGKGAFLNGRSIFNTSKREKLIAADSIFHSTTEAINFLNRHEVHNIKRYGSAIKFGKLAEGDVDIYVRLNGSKEWDTAAGHIILKEAGCSIFGVSSKKEISYNKKFIENEHFIAVRTDLVDLYKKMI